MNHALESTHSLFDDNNTLLSTYSESGSCHSGVLGEIEIFKMAAKMAAANKNNIKTAITSLLIYLGTYFRILCHICIHCCKSKMAAKMSAANMKHYNNHNQTHLSMAYVRKYCYIIQLQSVPTRCITPSKHSRSSVITQVEVITVTVHVFFRCADLVVHLSSIP